LDDILATDDANGENNEPYEIETVDELTESKEETSSPPERVVRKRSRSRSASKKEDEKEDFSDAELDSDVDDSGLWLRTFSNHTIICECDEFGDLYEVLDSSA